MSGEASPEPSEKDLQHMVETAQLITEHAAVVHAIEQVLDIESGLDDIVIRATRRDMEQDGTL